MHYYSFHIGDYRAATAHLTNEEDLAYRRLIDMYYDSEGCIPLDTQWVSRRIRVAIEVVEVVLKDMFEHTENGWKSQRCDDEIARYRHNAEKNKANGSKGGRPKKNPMETQWEPNQKATNNHKPITINQEPKINTSAPRFDAIQHLVSLGVIEQVARDYCQQRKKKLTETAANGIYKQAQKAGISLNKALEICCARGWEGFKSDWITNNQADKRTEHQKRQDAQTQAIFGHIYNTQQPTNFIEGEVYEEPPIARRLGR